VRHEAAVQAADVARQGNSPLTSSLGIRVPPLPRPGEGLRGGEGRPSAEGSPNYHFRNDPPTHLAALGTGAGAPYPLTAPALIPFMNCSLSSTYRTTIGVIEITRPAARPPTSRKCSPTHRNEASGTVASSGLVTSVSA
jgi:hypothetical protein